MRRPLATWLLLFAAYCAALIGEGAVQPEGTPVNSVRSPKISDRANAHSELRRQRIELVRALMDVLRSASDKDSTSQDTGRRWQSPKYLAIVLLGDVRAEEAVKLLARNITWRVTPPYGGTKPRLVQGQFPAAESLARIGGTAVPAVLGILHRDTNPIERHVCVWTLIAIDGRDVARFRIEKAIERCRFSRTKANLEAALEYFDKQHLDLVPDSGAVNAKDD